MSKLSEKQLLLLTIGVTVVIVGALTFLIMGDRGEIENLETEIEGIEAQIRAADVEINKIPGREERVLVFRAVEPDELAVLPSHQHINEFLAGLSTFLHQAGVEFQKLPESTPTPSQIASGIFVTRSPLTCRGDAASILKFLNMVENDPRLISVKGFQMQSGQAKKQEPGAHIVHDVEMTLETYYYNPTAAGFKRVTISDEAGKLQDEKLKALIAEFEPERPDTYLLRPSLSRRDPFVDPRKERVPENADQFEAQYARESEVVANLEKLHAEIVERVEMHRALVEAGDWFRADQIVSEIEELIANLKARVRFVLDNKEVTLPDLVAKVNAIHDHVDALDKRRPEKQNTVPAGLAEDVYKKIAELFEAGSYTEVNSECTSWKAFLSGKKVEPGAREWDERIDHLRSRAKTLGELKALTIRVTGTILDGDDPSRNMAYVNGDSVRVGDTLDEAREIRVVGIDRHGITLRYRGESVRITAQGATPQLGGRAGREATPRPVGSGR